VVSDDLSHYGPEEWDLVCAVRTAPDAPVGLTDPFTDGGYPGWFGALGGRTMSA